MADKEAKEVIVTDERTVQQRLIDVMRDVEAVKKTERNTSQNFSFRGIDSVVNAVGPALRKHGVMVVPDVLEHHLSTVEVGQKRTQMGHVLVKVRYSFYGDKGLEDVISCIVLGESMDSGDKATPKAMSVAFRIALLQALALPTDEPDPDSYAYERAEAKPKATISQIDLWAGGLASATTIEQLNQIAGTVATYDVAEDIAADLRNTYRNRKSEIEDFEKHVKAEMEAAAKG